MSLFCDESLGSGEEGGPPSGKRPMPADSDICVEPPTKRCLIDFETGEPIILADDDRDEKDDDDIEILTTKPGNQLPKPPNLTTTFKGATLYGQKLVFPESASESRSAVPSLLHESKRSFSGKPRNYTVTNISDIVSASSSSSSSTGSCGSKKQFIEIGQVLLNQKTKVLSSSAPSDDRGDDDGRGGGEGEGGGERGDDDTSNCGLKPASQLSLHWRQERETPNGRPVYRFQTGRDLYRDIERRKREIASYKRTKEQLAKFVRKPTITEIKEKMIREQELKKKLEAMKTIRPKEGSSDRRKEMMDMREEPDEMVERLVKEQQLKHKLESMKTIRPKEGASEPSEKAIDCATNGEPQNSKMATEDKLEFLAVKSRIQAKYEIDVGDSFEWK